MSVLDNIMVGRHHLLKKQFHQRESLYWLTGARGARNLSNRRKVERNHRLSSTCNRCARRLAGTLPYGLRKRVELARAMGVGAATDPARRADGRYEL